MNSRQADFNESFGSTQSRVACVRHNSHGKFLSNRFSLIELIIVMVIVVILLGLGIAAYANAKGSKGPTACANRIVDLITLTRQRAINDNLRIALLLPTKNDFSYADDYLKRMTLPTFLNESPGIAVRMCEVNAENEFVGWLSGCGWEIMPEGGYFVHSTTENTITGIPSTVVGHGGCVAVVFKSNGTLPRPGNVTITVRPFSKKTQSYSPGAAAEYDVEVNWLTGLTKTTVKKWQNGSWR